MHQHLTSYRKPTREDLARVGGLCGLMGGAWLASLALEYGWHSTVETIGIVAIGVIAAAVTQVGIRGPQGRR
jgi:hypothetical protein